MIDTDDSLPDGVSASQSQQRLERLSRRDGIAREDIGGYSRFVRMMRLAFPLAAVVVIAIVFLRTGQKDAIVPVRVDENDLASRQITRNELLNPKFESMDNKGQPYKITASRAVQGEVNKDLVMLESPVGVLTMNDGIKVNVRSATGAYRQDTERFFLEGDVFLEHDRGYTLHSAEAHIDLKNNFAWSEKPVKGTGPDLKIDATSMRANGKTGEIVFLGPAKLTLESGFEGLK